MTPQKTSNQFSQTLTVELLALDLSACSRCRDSRSNVERAIATLEPILASTGTAVELHKIVVESEAQARQLKFVSSPTIRVNGRDIILETTESRCGDCSDISGSEGGTACRTWSYRGEIHTEAPVGAIVDAILRAIYRDEVLVPMVSTTFEVPQNLQRFFRDKAKKASSSATESGVIIGCVCS